MKLIYSQHSLIQRVAVNETRGCSIKCVKVRKVIINNFDHGKERNEEKREAITIE